MSKEGRKFEPISGLDLPEEQGEAPEGKDIEYGTLVLKLKGQDPVVFDILSNNTNTKIFLVEFFMEFGQEIYNTLKEEDERTQKDL